MFPEWLNRWPEDHPVAFTIGLFLIGCIVSVYGESIRAFLRERPQRLNLWILKSRLTTASAGLRQLMRFDKDPKLFVFFAIRGFAYSAAMTFLVLVGLSGIVIKQLKFGLVVNWPTSWQPYFSIVLLFCSVPPFARLYQIYSWAGKLVRYEESMAAYRNTIAQITQRLDRSG